MCSYNYAIKYMYKNINVQFECLRLRNATNELNLIRKLPILSFAVTVFCLLQSAFCAVHLNELLACGGLFQGNISI